MRRWICIVALLAGFVREDYVRLAKPVPIIPTEQPIDRLSWRGPETQPWDWWFLP